MNCDQADDLTKDYTILSPNTICADYLTDEGIIECYASSELMIANYAVSMQVTFYHYDGVQTATNIYSGVNLNVISFINTPPVFQQDIDEDKIYIRENEEELYYLPEVNEKDPNQEAKVISSDAPPFVQIFQTYLKISPIQGSLGIYSFTISVVDNYEDPETTDYLLFIEVREGS